jgi:hypothetical protein
VSRAYTVRFLLGLEAVNESDYVVPAGLRAIVTDIAYFDRSNLSRQFGVSVAGAFIFYVVIPANSGASVAWHGKAVAYPGEVIGALSSGDMDYQVCGYLFDN